MGRIEEMKEYVLYSLLSDKFGRIQVDLSELLESELKEGDRKSLKLANIITDLCNLKYLFDIYIQDKSSWFKEKNPI